MRDAGVVTQARADAGDSGAEVDAGIKGRPAEQAGSDAASSACAGRNAGETFCDKLTLIRCDAAGGAATQQSCKSEALCQLGVSHAVCAKCEPGSYTCDGPKLSKCDAKGQYIPTSRKPYADSDACQRAAADLHAQCHAGEHKCVDDALYICDDAELDFVRDTALDVCGKGLCNAQLGKCNVCLPGSATCNDAGDARSVCSDDGQSQSPQACPKDSPVCVDGACAACRLDDTAGNTGCGSDQICKRVDDQVSCEAMTQSEPGLRIEFCHAGACKVRLAQHYELHFAADWSQCKGAASQAPAAADSAGVMLWPTTLLDLAIPLADSGWFCKLPPNGALSTCIVNASQSARELYFWGPVESACTFVWQNTSHGIDAALGSGCGMCKLETSSPNLGSYAFNMGIDAMCRCPKITFTAVPAKD